MWISMCSDQTHTYRLCLGPGLCVGIAHTDADCVWTYCTGTVCACACFFDCVHVCLCQGKVCLKSSTWGQQAVQRCQLFIHDQNPQEPFNQPTHLELRPGSYTLLLLFYFYLFSISSFCSFVLNHSKEVISLFQISVISVYHQPSSELIISPKTSRLNTNTDMHTRAWWHWGWIIG